MKKRVGVLISGRGSNLQALLDAQGPYAPYDIVAVVSNNPDAYGLERAREAGVEALAFDHRPFKKDREAYERVVDAALRGRGVEIVALAGFMRVLSPFFVRAWAGRLINIHPSLLPLFPGLDTHARAIEAKAGRHGCTVHLVTEEVDVGPIIGQAGLDILPDDTPDSLAARVLELEHELYPQALAKLARGEVSAG